MPTKTPSVINYITIQDAKLAVDSSLFGLIIDIRSFDATNGLEGYSYAHIKNAVNAPIIGNLSTETIFSRKTKQHKSKNFFLSSKQLQFFFHDYVLPKQF